MAKKILAIDPGPEKSAWVLYDPDAGIIDKGIDSSLILSGMIYLSCSKIPKIDEVVVEAIESYGMPVGKSVFETCYYVGDYRAAWRYSRKSIEDTVFEHFHLLSRRSVKLHLCNSVRAKDSNIRQAIIDRYPATGGGKTPQIGTKKQPGPLYGIHKDLWSALAIAITWSELLQGE